MKILTRRQFADLFNKQKPGLGDDDSPLWFSDHVGDPSCFFVRIAKPIKQYTLHARWCETHLDGLVRCYSSSSDNGEWWGFTNKDDIVLWSLRWG